MGVIAHPDYPTQLNFMIPLGPCQGGLEQQID
jgi:hypothetical protein